MKVTPQRVHQWICEGIIPVELDGKIDYQKAKKAVEANLDPLRRQAWVEGTEGEASSILEEKRRKLMVERKLKELEYLVETKKLIPREEVLQGFLERIRVVKSGLLGLSRTLPPKLVGKDVREMGEIIKREVYNLLESYSRPNGISHYAGEDEEKFKVEVGKLVQSERR